MHILAGVIENSTTMHSTYCRNSMKEYESMKVAILNIASEKNDSDTSSRGESYREKE